MSFVKRSLTNLPLDELIGAPLTACAKAQKLLAETTIDFIKEIGLQNGKDASGQTTLEAVVVNFTYSILKQEDASGLPTTSKTTEKKTITVPLLTIVNVPSLSVQTCDINFKMKVSQSRTTKSSASLSAKYKSWLSPVSVSFNGSVSSESNKSASATYTVNVAAADNGPPQGLVTVLDMLNKAIFED